MNHISFTIPGPVVPWARARQNGKRYFTDPKVQAYKDEVGLRARAAGAKPSDRPVVMTIDAYMPIPASWSRKRKDEALRGLERPTGKPDWDNIGKGISDALNGIAYIDDAQIVSCQVMKKYAHTPEVRVWIWYE